LASLAPFKASTADAVASNEPAASAASIAAQRH
jgi:hypothetical protein